MTRTLRWVTLSDGRQVCRFFDDQPRPDNRAAFATPMISSDYAAYDCPITGRPVEGRAAHRENLARHGCRILEAGEKEDVQRNGRARLEAKIDRSVDEAVDAIAKDFI